MPPRVLPGTVVTRYPGTLHGVDAEFLRQVSAELEARFIQMMTEMYDLKNYLFHRDLMLDYLEGYWIGADDDPTDPYPENVNMLLPSDIEKITEETRKFIDDLAGVDASNAGALAARLTKLAERWTDVNIRLANGRTLVLHPAAQNGLSMGRYDPACFANLSVPRNNPAYAASMLDFVVGAGDVVPHATEEGAHVRITVRAPRMYDILRDASEPAFPPSNRESIARIRLGSRACYFATDIPAANALPGDGYYRFTPRGCARHIAPGLYWRRLSTDEAP